ncbi:hypothetical protein BN961_02549 [Afipia felis]|uniref:Uncharacterized protein n=1 Tax=Afipia felis TaxID=1035 RepID=A0A090N7T8_AFIFE|nr:hypothetical protein AfiDRAFT_2784 [Afipia sp. 1NLS2]CEG09128.1 hypothetical protein BN961_02549 [Afipia felis]
MLLKLKVQQGRRRDPFYTARSALLIAPSSNVALLKSQNAFIAFGLLSSSIFNLLKFFMSNIAYFS